MFISPTTCSLAGQRMRGLREFRPRSGPAGCRAESTQAESPEWTPASSMCSMMPATTTCCAVADGVDVDFDGVFQKAVDQHRLALGDDERLGHEPLELRSGRSRFPSPGRRARSLAAPAPGSRSWPASARAWAMVRAMPLAGCFSPSRVQQLLELLAVLGVFDRVDAGADDRHARASPARGPGSAASARRTARSRRRAARGRRC